MEVLHKTVDCNSGVALETITSYKLTKLLAFYINSIDGIEYI